MVCGHPCVLTDMQELASQLKEARDANIKLIVSDGVFSMDGSITPLPYVDLCIHNYMSAALALNITIFIQGDVPACRAGECIDIP